MISSSTEGLRAALSDHPRARDWFLRDSCWDDEHWVLAPTSALQEDRPIVIRWDFPLPGDRRFTHSRHTALLESAKQHLALLRVGAPGSARGCSGYSLRIYFQCFRALIRWMSMEGLARFADMDVDSIEAFKQVVRRRRGYAARTISRETLRHHYHVLLSLYRHRRVVNDSLQIDPLLGLNARAATAHRIHDPKVAPYTPDAVAIPLIQGAIEFLSASALPIIAARERALRVYNHVRAKSGDRDRARREMNQALSKISIDTPQGPRKLGSYGSLSMLIDLLYGACFVVISYLVGPRVSEILHLQVGCAQPFDNGSGDTAPLGAMIVGTIYKAESYHGRRHQWIAPAPAVHAISVLEALSAPHRARTGGTDLWQRPRIGRFGISEWLPDSGLKLRVSDTRSANERVNRLAHWLKVPSYNGQPWRLTSHQGRKTFARFAALRDRTALYALAQHLGHRDPRQTDQAYVGTDYNLEQEIETAVLDASVSAWEQMLTAPALGGRMGAEVIARRPRFRGASIKQEIRTYARMLAETGLALGVCEWGYCVYREDFSACHGSAMAPDPVRREPSTCVRCKNFSVTEAHRPYWNDQVDRYERLLNDSRLPTQTLKISRARLEEARTLIRSLDICIKETRRGRPVDR
jgi:integrase